MNLKQLFCKHVWDTFEEKYLRTIRAYDRWFPSFLYKDYNVYAEHQNCLKCEKIRWIEKERLINEEYT